MSSTDRTITASITIEADAATIFDVLADPGQHCLFDGSNTVKGRISGPPRLYLGAVFAMRMRRGAPYAMRNRVIEWDEDRLIAWRHFGRHVWRWTLEPLQDGRTQVREAFDYGPSPAAGFYELIKVPQGNAKAIEASLQNLKVLVESRARLV